MTVARHRVSPVGDTERREVRPRFGCSVPTRGDVAIVSSHLLAGAPSPVRALMSHLRVQGAALTAIQRRYDLVMADSALELRDVRYRYQDAIEAGSDHGTVEATLRL